MPSTVPIAHLLSDVWFDRPKVEEEEYRYQVYLAKQRGGGGSGVAEQIAQARQIIHQSLQGSDAGSRGEDVGKINKLQKENEDLKKLVNGLVERMNAMEARLSKLESGKGEAPAPATQQQQKPTVEQKAEESDDSDDVDLFGSDSDDEEADKIRQERLAEYAAKKAKKPALIAKSTIVLDIKPWDDETDMKEVERLVRGIETDGLLWGASKLVKVAFGIMKLQISCVVEDDKVGTDFLEEEITGFDDHVQSVDIVAFNKI